MLLNNSIKTLSQKLKSREISPIDLINESILQIEKTKSLNAFITLNNLESIKKLAADTDLTTPLSGIPFVLKDSYLTKNIRTTAASNLLNNFVPQYSSTVYAKLQQSGAILIGKTNMDAWGHGASNENSDFGVVKNAWDNSRVAGGSSGGAAVAVSTQTCTFGIGEDTGGSIRNPAGWNNICGLKVTYGRVSRYGCIAYASSFDTVGPMAKSVEDLAYVLQEIAGLDQFDATSSPTKVLNYTQNINQGVKGLKIGLPKEFFSEGMDHEVKKLVLDSAKKFEQLGASIVEVSLPMLKYAVSVYYLLAPSETSSNLGRYDGIRYGGGRDLFTDETIRRIMVGTYALSAGYYDAYYKKAQKARTLIIQDYQKVFSTCDVLLCPVSPTPATKIGELINDPIKNMLADIFTTTTNPAGIPSLALPCGFTSAGLPVGMQIQGNLFTEDLLFRIGHAYQQNTDFHLQKPKLDNI